MKSPRSSLLREGQQTRTSILGGDDLCIRPFEDRDINAFVTAVHESVSTAEVWIPWITASYSTHDAQAWFKQCKDHLQADFAYDLGIFSRCGNMLYDGISINQINLRHNFGTIGYWVRQSCQRKGIATSAVKRISSFGFNELKLTRLEIIIAETNLASRCVAEKVGATFECIARNRLLIRGQPIAAAVYSLTNSG